MPWKPLDEPTDDEQRELDSQRGKARFLVDESMGVGVARILEAHGHNAKSVVEFGLEGRSDEDVLAAAWKDKRVLVTHDADFLDDRRFPPHRNPGIIVIRAGASGRDNDGLLLCLRKALLIAGTNAPWFIGKKLDFKSEDALTITSLRGGRNRYLWTKHGMPMVWED